MYPLDHIMVETEAPLESANAMAERFGLPFAWPLTEGADYTSAGINAGTIKLEFIRFNTRFGIPGRSFSGLSGLAFRSTSPKEQELNRLALLGLQCRVGEECPSHTTITVEEDAIFPTIFLVHYHFDTSGWQARLQREFAECHGGKLGISRFRSVSIAGKLPKALEQEFEVSENPNAVQKTQLVFEAHALDAPRLVISDAIENLDIVLVQAAPPVDGPHRPGLPEASRPYHPV